MSQAHVHVCCVCGHKWSSLDKETERHIINAVKVNKQGPFCYLCMYLTMAERHAEARGLDLKSHLSRWLKLPKP